MLYKKTVALMMAVALLLLSSLQVCLAYESTEPMDSGAAQMDSSPPPGLLGGEAPKLSADMVFTFAELTDWLSSHKKTGGTVRLGSDIIVEKSMRYTFSSSWKDKTCYIDTGEHTIYVRGALDLNPPYLSFTGKGGEEGIFHVEEGGFLWINSDVSYGVVPVTATEGYAIYQEEGAFIDVCDTPILGTVHYAEKPVAWPDYAIAEFYGRVENLPLVVLPLKGEFDPNIFPQTDKSRLSVNGQNAEQRERLPVVWDFEAYKEKIAAKERFVLTGRYSDDVHAMAPPASMVVFLRKNAAVFLQCGAQKVDGGEKLRVTLNIKLDDPTTEYRLECSTDNVNWWEADPNGWYGWFENTGEDLIYENVFWEPEMPRFFSVAVTDSEGKTTYSDTIELVGDDKIAGWDNGGGRNGETTPGDPGDGVLPPPVRPPNPPAGGDSSGSGSGGDLSDQDVYRMRKPPARAALSPDEPTKKAETVAAVSSLSSGVQAEPIQPETPDPIQLVPAPEPEPLGQVRDLTEEPPAAPPLSEEIPASVNAFPKAPFLDSRAGQIAAGVAVIALLGAPVYGAPLIRLLRKRWIFRKKP